MLSVEEIESLKEKFVDLIELTPIRISKLFCEVRNPNKNNELMARIYEVFFAEGNMPRFVYVNGKEALRLGNIEIKIRPMTNIEVLDLLNIMEEDYKICNLLYENYRKEIRFIKDVRKRISKSYETENIKQSIFALHCEKTMFYTTEMNINSLKTKNLIQNDMENIVESFICNNYNIDHVLFESFKTSMPIINSGMIMPDEYMKYNAHQLLFTGTKTGKTSVAERMGIRIERASISALMGFSSSDKSRSGALNNQTLPFAFDEILEETETDVWSKLMTMMEQGKATIMKGIQDVDCTTWSSLKFMGNPRETSMQKDMIMPVSEEESLARSFADMLNVISTNTEAFGSRMGFIVYENQMKTAVGSGYPRKSYKLLERYFNTLRESLKVPYTNLFFNPEIEKWLNQPYNKEYVDLIENIKADMNQDIKPLIRFISGHINSYRHARGVALNLAVVSHMEDLINGCLNMDEFKETLEEKMNFVQTTNLKNIANLSKVLSEKYSKQIIASRINNMPEHIKAFLYAVRDYEIGEYLLNDLNNEKIRNKFVTSNRGTPEMLRRLTKNIRKTNMEIEDLAIMIEVDKFYILKENRLKKIFEIISPEEKSEEKPEEKLEENPMIDNAERDEKVSIAREDRDYGNLSYGDGFG